MTGPGSVDDVGAQVFRAPGIPFRTSYLKDLPVTVSWLPGSAATNGSGNFKKHYRTGLWSTRGPPGGWCHSTPPSYNGRPKVPPPASSLGSVASHTSFMLTTVPLQFRLDDLFKGTFAEDLNCSVGAGATYGPPDLPAPVTLAECFRHCREDPECDAIRVNWFTIPNNWTEMKVGCGYGLSTYVKTRKH